MMNNIFHQNFPRPPVVPGEEVGCLREVEGKSLSPDCGSPASYLGWATSLPVLLADPQGVRLFTSYLQQEGRAHADALNFWFACNGLHKETDPDKIQQIIKVIYRQFFVKSQLGVRDGLRKWVHSRLGGGEPASVTVFDKVQREVEQLITDTTYPNFLRSDVYLSYVRDMQDPHRRVGDESCGSGGSSGGSGGSGSSAGGTGKRLPLATVHEDQELETRNPPTFPALTKDALIMTQRLRASDALRPSSEAFAHCMQGRSGGLHRMYSSYVPVSRQDSELQSLSSDARTESDMSLTDSSVDGSNHHRMSRKHYQMHCRKLKEGIILNREPCAVIIPRTIRQQAEQLEPEIFAKILMEKLEDVKKEQEARDKLDHKLFESQGIGRSLAEAIREKFQIDDDDGQHILDQHVSRVWSDLTPGDTSPRGPRPRSPDISHRPQLPCPKAAHLSKVSVNGGVGLSHGQQTTHSYPTTRPYSNRHSRKEKDAFSTFSSDSGNVHDFSEGYDRLHLPKSKSVPDYSESSDAYSSLPGGRGSNSRDWSGSGRRHSKKPDFTDSGVSVNSETISNHSTQFKERVLCWLMESKTGAGAGTVGAHSDRESCSSSTRCCHDCKHSSRSSNPPTKGRTRSPLSEISCGEDLSRRRTDDHSKSKSKQSRSVSGGSMVRSRHEEGFTTVVFSFCDEQFPYRSKIPGTSITLKQFKEFLPKKGNYRYFFKTECEDVDMKVIQEEMTEDNDVLPLWEGKVMALVKPAD